MKLAAVELLFQRRLKVEALTPQRCSKSCRAHAKTSVFAFHYYPQHLLYQDKLERKLGNTYINCFQSCYSTLRRNISSSNTNTICLQHAQHTTWENRLSQTGNARSKFACVVLCRMTPDYVKTGTACLEVLVPKWSTSRVRLPRGVSPFYLIHLSCLLLEKDRAAQMSASRVIGGVPWHFQKWRMVCRRPVPSCSGRWSSSRTPSHDTKCQGLSPWFLPQSLLLPTPFLPSSSSLSLSFLPVSLPLWSSYMRHVSHPSVVPWEEAGRLLLLMSALAHIILGTDQESCLELLYS